LPDTKDPDVGTVVKDFSLQTADGKTFTLSENKGKIIILEFGACSCEHYLSLIPEMEDIVTEFEDKDVIFFTVYTREPYPGEEIRNSNSNSKKHNKSTEKYFDPALEIIMEHNRKRQVLIDIVGPNYIMKTLGGSRTHSLIVIDREGRVALWQEWVDPKALRTKLKEITKK